MQKAIILWNHLSLSERIIDTPDPDERRHLVEAISGGSAITREYVRRLKSKENRVTQEAERLVAEMSEAIEKLDDIRMMEVVGVAQALSELRSSLDGVDELLNERRFEAASALGYGDVSSNFIFLQRTLAGLQAAEHKKCELVQTVAQKAKLSYEEAAPFVECKLKSSIPRDPGQTVPSSEEVKKRLREKFGLFEDADG